MHHYNYHITIHTVEKVLINMVGIGDLDWLLLGYGRMFIFNHLIMEGLILSMLEL